MQEKSNQSPTKFKIVLIAFLVLILSIFLTVTAIYQIVNTHKLNDKLAQQERRIEELSSQYDTLLGE